MSIRRKPNQYGLVLKCDVHGCAETFDTGQVHAKKARGHAIAQLGWQRFKTDAFGAMRVNDLCALHAAEAVARRQRIIAARRARIDARAAGKKYLATPATGWAACPGCGAHVLKRSDGALRAHTPGLGAYRKARGQCAATAEAVSPC